MFICPKCKKELKGFQPDKCVCGYQVPQIDLIYQFCDEPPISLEQDGRKYLGYEGVGENFSPSIAFGENKSDDYGLYGACSRKLVELLGKDCVVLDLGAGLGTASIPLAMAGSKTIAADISQKMLLSAVKSSLERKLEGSLIFARMNAYNLPIADNSVNAVVAIDLLHQVDNPEAVVKEILRVLKPEGIFVHYGCKGLPITNEQDEIHRKCEMALRDIQRYYQDALMEFGYRGLPFESWKSANECINKYFEKPEVIPTDYSEVWTGKMKYRIYKLNTRASGSTQLISNEIHNAAWKKTNEYATQKYGSDYMYMPGYSKYTGMLELYRIKY
jgi:ubiquinone/menaquinone biosynthesis C-methylase UbiE